MRCPLIKITLATVLHASGAGLVEAIELASALAEAVEPPSAFGAAGPSAKAQIARTSLMIEALRELKSELLRAGDDDRTVEISDDDDRTVEISDDVRVPAGTTVFYANASEGIRSFEVAAKDARQVEFTKWARKRGASTPERAAELALARANSDRGRKKIRAALARYRKEHPADA